MASDAKTRPWLLIKGERFVEHDIPQRKGPPESGDDLPNYVGRVTRRSPDQRTGLIGFCLDTDKRRYSQAKSDEQYYRLEKPEAGRIRNEFINFEVTLPMEARLEYGPADHVHVISATSASYSGSL